MLAALTLSQAFCVRASIELADAVQRFWVFSPSVISTITLSRSAAGAGALNGSFGDSSWKAQERPMVTLVLPVGVIASILACSAVQSSVSGIIDVGQAGAWWARNSVAGAPATVVVLLTSLFWSRSLTQPFHWLCGLGVQTLLCDSQLDFEE